MSLTRVLSRLIVAVVTASLLACESPFGSNEDVIEQEGVIVSATEDGSLIDQGDPADAADRVYLHFRSGLRILAPGDSPLSTRDHTALVAGTRVRVTVTQVQMDSEPPQRGVFRILILE